MLDQANDNPRTALFYVWTYSGGMCSFVKAVAALRA